MAKYELNKLDPKPEFDMWFYAELSGETRFSQDLMDEFEPRWDSWLEKINAYEISNTEGSGNFMLIYLDKEVDEEIDAIWDDSPTMGLSFHNLAVCMVMTAAKSLMPELEDGKCAPLPRAGLGVQEAVEALGIEWTSENAINRKYAVYTPYPYSGGCEICTMSNSCPNSTMRSQ